VISVNVIIRSILSDLQRPQGIITIKFEFKISLVSVIIWLKSSVYSTHFFGVAYLVVFISFFKFITSFVSPLPLSLDHGSSPKMMSYGTAKQ
jgi:hypothetical protein